jgi:hypothetical protein
VRFNPCGAVVDYRRAPFSSTYKPYRNSDETVIVRWYEAQPNARTLPFPSIIDVPDWDGEGYTYLEGGWVFDSPEPFAPWGTIAGALGDRFCGTEMDFREGCDYRPDLPPVRYNSTGLARCCLGPVGANVGAGVGPTSIAKALPLLDLAATVGGGPNADVIVYPPGQPLGTSSTGSTIIPIGAVNTGELTVGTQLWVSVIVVIPGTYTITLTGIGDTDVMLQFFTGTAPSGLIPIPLAHVGGSDTWTGGVLMAGQVWLLITGVLSGGTFNVSIGP